MTICDILSTGASFELPVEPDDACEELVALTNGSNRFSLLSSTDI